MGGKKLSTRESPGLCETSTKKVQNKPKETLLLVCLKKADGEQWGKENGAVRRAVAFRRGIYLK